MLPLLLPVVLAARPPVARADAPVTLTRFTLPGLDDVLAPGGCCPTTATVSGEDIQVDASACDPAVAAAVTAAALDWSLSSRKPTELRVDFGRTDAGETLAAIRHPVSTGAPPFDGYAAVEHIALKRAARHRYPAAGWERQLPPERCEVRMDVGPNGRVTHHTVSACSAPFMEEVDRASPRNRFTPLRVDGEPRATQYILGVKFIRQGQMLPPGPPADPLGVTAGCMATVR